jgi:hypothetical protein
MKEGGVPPIRQAGNGSADQRIVSATLSSSPPEVGRPLAIAAALAVIATSEDRILGQHHAKSTMGDQDRLTSRDVPVEVRIGWA